MFEGSKKYIDRNRDVLSKMHGSNMKPLKKEKIRQILFSEDGRHSCLPLSVEMDI